MAGRPLQHTLLWLFLGFLGLSALVAIGSLFSGELGPTAWRILGTSAGISGASVLAMSCAAFRARERGRGLGTLGIALAVVATCAMLVAVWGEFRHDDVPVKVAFVSWILAAGTAHAELMWLPVLAPRFRWVQRTVTGSILLLQAMLTVLVIGDARDEDLILLCTVVSILVALQSLAVPVLWKLSRGADAAPVGRLLLRQTATGSWVDEAGNRYAVRQLGPGEP